MYSQKNTRYYQIEKKEKKTPNIPFDRKNVRKK